MRNLSINIVRAPPSTYLLTHRIEKFLRLFLKERFIKTFEFLGY